MSPRIRRILTAAGTTTGAAVLALAASGTPTALAEYHDMKTDRGTVNLAEYHDMRKPR